MEDNTNWTPSPEENLLGLTARNAINKLEAQGLATAELFVFELDAEQPISTTIILEIHKIAFGSFMIGLESGVIQRWPSGNLFRRRLSRCYSRCTSFLTT